MVAMEPPSTQRRRRDPRREAEGAALAEAVHAGERRRATSCAASTAPAPSTASRCPATSRKPRCRRQPHRDLRRAAHRGAELALGRRAVLPAHRQAAGRARRADRRQLPADAAHRSFPGAQPRRTSWSSSCSPRTASSCTCSPPRAPARPRRCRRCRSTSTSTRPSPTNRVGAYERLLLDVIAGRLNLFVRSDEQEEAWRWVEPILRRLAQRRRRPAPLRRRHLGPAGGQRAGRARRLRLGRRGSSTARASAGDDRAPRPRTVAR